MPDITRFNPFRELARFDPFGADDWFKGFSLRPVLNGFEATRSIRAGSGPNARTPIIALTANAMQSDKDACLDAGMDAFLTKPFNKEGLAECIERLIGGRQSAPMPL